MSRDWRLFIEDMLAGCLYIDEFTRGMSQAEFLADARTYWATIKMIEIIGEASRNIPNDIKARFPDVEWANMTATRNVFAHRYFGIDEDVLWSIIQDDIAELLDHLKRIDLEESKEHADE